MEPENRIAPGLTEPANRRRAGTAPGCSGHGPRIREHGTDGSGRRNVHEVETCPGLIGDGRTRFGRRRYARTEKHICSRRTEGSMRLLILCRFDNDWDASGARARASPTSAGYRQSVWHDAQASGRRGPCAACPVLWLGGGRCAAGSAAGRLRSRCIRSIHDLDTVRVIAHERLWPTEIYRIQDDSFIRFRKDDVTQVVNRLIERPVKILETNALAQTLFRLVEACGCAWETTLRGQGWPGVTSRLVPATVVARNQPAMTMANPVP